MTLIHVIEELVRNTRSSLQKAREAYSAAIAQRSASQREVNELLQRKHAWTPNDLERFTALYRSDHVNEQAESAAQENLATEEQKAEEAAAKLSKSILARYHEEQIWSDKIRRMSTWGTWGLMGVNVLLFLVFQIGVEPWRRKRLVKGFEEKVMEALEREGPIKGATLVESQALQSLPTPDPGPTDVQKDPTPSPEPTPPTIIEETQNAGNSEGRREFGIAEISLEHEIALVPEPTAPLSTLESFRKTVRDMFSDRQITLRRVDLTAVALEGAAAGFALVGLVVILLRPR